MDIPVGIALSRVGRSGDRIAVGARFSATAQTDPAAHPFLYNDYHVSFQWGVDQLPHIAPTLKKE